MDGHELRLAVNYLAPVLLTRGLLPLLTKSAPARIVQVSSVGQQPFDIADIEFEHGYRGVEAYRRAKLALIADTFELARDLAGSGVTVNAVHPAGFMDTAMVRESGVRPLSTVADGGRAVLNLITDPALVTMTGQFLNGTEISTALAPANDAQWRRDLRVATDRILNGEY